MDSKTLALKIRKHAIEMTGKSGASHIGSILSVTDIISVLYACILKFDIKNPLCTERDYLILSKGHSGVALYSALAEIGFFPVSELDKYYCNGGTLSGHVSHIGVPGVEFSTGSLGHGFSVGCGLALICKNEKKKNQVYVIIGDGECNEGSIWEAALFANQFKLDNLTVIVDSNKMQAMGACEEIIELSPFKEKWKSFGFNVIDIDGHNHDELLYAFNVKFENSSPKCIIANTVKGKGISFMEGNLMWHYKDPSGTAYIKAIKELEEK